MMIAPRAQEALAYSSAVPEAANASRALGWKTSSGEMPEPPLDCADVSALRLDQCATMKMTDDGSESSSNENRKSSAKVSA
jgi:hypothetical protein